MWFLGWLLGALIVDAVVGKPEDSADQTGLGAAPSATTPASLIDVTQLTTAQIAALTADQIAALSTANIHALSSAQAAVVSIGI